MASRRARITSARSTEATEQLNQARLALREAENSRDALKRQFTGEDSVILPERMTSGRWSVSVPELDGRYRRPKKSSMPCSSNTPTSTPT